MNSSEPDYHIPSLGVAYEVARETLSELLGYAANRLHKEQSKPEPDPAVIDEWQGKFDRWGALFDTLRSDDIAMVRSVLDDGGALLKSLRQQS